MKKNDASLYHVFPSLKPHNNSLPDRLFYNMEKEES